MRIAVHRILGALLCCLACDLEDEAAPDGPISCVDGPEAEFAANTQTREADDVHAGAFEGTLDVQGTLFVAETTDDGVYLRQVADGRLGNSYRFLATYVRGIATAEGKVWALTDDEVFEIDTNSGVRQRLGTTAGKPSSPNSHPLALQHDDGNLLYVVDEAPRLVVMDPLTGTYVRHAFDATDFVVVDGTIAGLQTRATVACDETPHCDPGLVADLLVYDYVADYSAGPTVIAQGLPAPTSSSLVWDDDGFVYLAADAVIHVSPQGECVQRFAQLDAYGASLVADATYLYASTRYNGSSGGNVFRIGRGDARMTNVFEWESDPHVQHASDGELLVLAGWGRQLLRIEM